jgi:hypothetical protein
MPGKIATKREHPGRATKLSGEMSALMLINIRKDSVINTKSNFKDMGAGQHRLT